MATPYRGVGANANIALAVEFDVSRLGFSEDQGALSGSIELTYLVTDATGKVRIPEQRQRSQVSIPAVVARDVTATGIRVVTQFELPAGRYQIRIGAGSSTLAGSLVYDLEVPELRGRLALSGIAVSAMPASAVPTLVLHDLLGSALPKPPVALRESSRSDTVAVYAEGHGSYGVPAPDVHVLLRNVRTGAAYPFPEVRPIAARVPEPDAVAVTATAPLAEREPGEYIIDVQARGADGRSASRQIPIRIR